MKDGRPVCRRSCVHLCPLHNDDTM
jgi:hypothetical protein